MSSTIAIVTHEPVCPPGLLGQAWTDAGFALSVHHPYRDTTDLPTDLDDFSGLVVLGGHMGAGSGAENPWIDPTQRLLRDAVDRGVPTLGVCLGHQLLAAALGGSVRVNDLGTRIGLTPVATTAAGAEDPLLAGADGERAVHWNSDVVTQVPTGASVLATAPDGTVQAVRYAERAWGVQFHPEVTAPIFTGWAQQYPDRTDLREIGATVETAAPELGRAWIAFAQRFADVMRSAHQTRNPWAP